MPVRRLAALAYVLLSLLLAPILAQADEARIATLYRDPECTCCTEYGRYLEANGFKVTVVSNTTELDAVKKKFKVPEHLAGCHSTVIEGYVVEGHVPITAINKLLAEKPPIAGISLPGMPEGSPGMAGAKTAAFPIFVITDEARPPLFAIE